MGCGKCFRALGDTLSTSQSLEDSPQGGVTTEYELLGPRGSGDLCSKACLPLFTSCPVARVGLPLGTLVAPTYAVGRMCNRH